MASLYPNLSILAWKIPWTEEPGLQSMESQSVRHDCATSTHTHTHTHTHTLTHQWLSSKESACSSGDAETWV